MTLTLYHHGSSACAAKVRFALEEKQLSWQGIYIDILKGEQFAPNFLAVNPKGVVPVLVDGDVTITESTIICEYIEDRFPEHAIYPTSAQLRAQVRAWTKAVDEELHPACSAITYVASHRYTIIDNGLGSFEDFLNTGGNAGKAARALKWQWIQKGINAPRVADKIKLYYSYLLKMEQTLSNAQWLVGNQFSMADIAMAPYVNRLSALALDAIWREGRLPNIERWFTRLEQRPAFTKALKDWVPEKLRVEMLSNGTKSQADIMRVLDL